MGRLSRSKAAAHGFGIFENTTNISGPGHNAAGDAPSRDHFASLQDRDPNSGRNTPDFIDSLTAKLKELHIYSPKKDRGNRSLQATVCHRLNRLNIDTKIVGTLGHVTEGAHHSTLNSAVTESTQGPFPGELLQRHTQDEGVLLSAETGTFQPVLLGQAPDSFEASDPNFLTQVLRAADLDHHALVIKPGIETSIARHKAGQYDYVLSVLDLDGGAKRDNTPSGRGGLTLDFGCNLLVQADRTPENVCGQSKPANAYKILATPLVTENAAQHVAQLPEETEDMATVAESSPARAGEEAVTNNSAHSGFAFSTAENKHSQEASLDQVENSKDRVVSVSTDESSVLVDGAPRTPSRSTSTSSRSRIEDSVEAIDRLEEELEAVHIAARLATPTRTGRDRSRTVDGAAVAATGLKRTPSTLKRTQSTSAGARPAPAARSAQRKSVSATANDAAKASPEKSPTRRPTVARPTSLLPPKPPAKSTKAPTKPSFELPGEAVARRIKEQREARLAQQAAKAASPAPQRSRSLKVPTRPNFELPGEAISRRKRAEREARLKAQEEEERKRREFKARPIKANLGSAASPRDTVTSRARQNKGSEAEDGQFEESQFKRRSMVGSPHTLARASSTRSPQTRGRGMSQTAMTDESSRATSTSTSGTSGKRSTLSAEELEHQRHIGKEIFQRDNCYIKDKERERREREWNAKMAREQAAERSRQASREWAEKQRRKQLAATAAKASQAA
ncbi:hypothetical protein LX32DRAFT_691089 [Colletotrichum zoysiae]|uniref:Carboxylesterase family protein n=1 Tax=Colletotrichum zoysiae TaxID=1216348 RepID=A0AAD9M840_9PEZI|nr:hypothetical protein LX32DRAFT_691089 [Colletotrichum zoysiae]